MINQDTDYRRLALVMILGLGVLRLVGGFFTPLGLHGDEAQYWAWSRSLDWGYFSKPPMIAWVIAATTSIFGNAEWAVRLSSPLLHPLIALVLFHIGNYLWSARTGFWAVAFYFLMPSVWLSSGIVSTDVPLLLCWSLALLAFLRLRGAGPDWRWAFLLGAGTGFGILSKYAMLFFGPAIAAALIFDRPSRRALLSRRGALAFILALIIAAPNIWWNANNDFATVTHTAANANIQGVPFHPVELIEFWASQFAVFGPLSFGMLIFAVIAALRGRLGKSGRVVSLFVLSPFLIISLEALLSRANANWAVTAYAAGSVLAARYVTFGDAHGTAKEKWAIGAAALNFGLGILLCVFTLLPSLADAVGGANAYKRLRGWPETVSHMVGVSAAGHDGRAFSAIAADNRIIFYDLLYYGAQEKSGLPLYMWMNTAHANNHGEATRPLPPSKAGDAPVLIINYYHDYADRLADDFARIKPLPTFTLDLGGGKTRTLYLWAGYGYTPTDKKQR